jgi:hypothetical protein
MTRTACFAILVIFCSGSGAFGDNTLTLLNEAQSMVMGGVYTSPYTLSINGTPTLAICDDFLTDISNGFTWNAVATSESSLVASDTLSDALPSADVRFDTTPSTNPTALQQGSDYSVAAYLAEELFAVYQTDETAAGEISYAIWDLFDPGLLNSDNTGFGTLLESERMAALQYLAVARLATTPFSANEYVTVYTASPNSHISQEFLTVSMAEPPSSAILGLYVLSFGVLSLIFRRRIVKSTGPAASSRIG